MTTTAIEKSSFDLSEELDSAITDLGGNTLLENIDHNFTDIAVTPPIDILNTDDGNQMIGQPVKKEENAQTETELSITNPSAPKKDFVPTDLQPSDDSLLKNSIVANEIEYIPSALAEEILMNGGNVDGEGHQQLISLQPHMAPDLIPFQEKSFYENEINEEDEPEPKDLEELAINLGTMEIKKHGIETIESWLAKKGNNYNLIQQDHDSLNLDLENDRLLESPTLEWPLDIEQELMGEPSHPTTPEVTEDTPEEAVTDEVIEKMELEVFADPNPFSEKTTIYFSHSEKRTLVLTDASGKTNATWTTRDKKFHLVAKGLSSGIYFLKIFSEDNLMQTLKLSIIR